ncbi:hypothetical protein B0O80DRAFT_436647 [Mortierella sp. GBAus27b]|nr:hypothetical protein BGX31_005981 [Mortierella sp. GBA43]KAI8361082.1 hypothetical protein B0O80DRAFT_436647 [Mortierella sp. GBAus27b]
MNPEVMQQLRVDDPMEEPELNLDGLEISSIQVLLEPPPALDEDATDMEDDFYSPLDHFQNLVKLSMSSSQCHSLEAFPNLPLLRSLMLADNLLVEGFEALAEADLQNLVRLDLSGNKISNLDVLKPLVALGNLQHLMLAENEAVVANQDDYRDTVFEILPQLITIDGLDRDGTEIDVDDDVTALSGDEDGHDIEDIGSDSDLDDQENRPPVGGKGKSVGHPPRADDDEEDDDELEDEDDEDDDEEEDEYEGEGTQQHQRGPASDEEEDDDEEVDDDEEEDEEDDEGDDGEEEGSDAPGLAYLLEDNIQDDNDEEFEPTNDVDEPSEMESSDEDEGGPQSSAAGGSNTNGHRSKRPRSPSSATGPSEFDQVGDFVDADGDDTTNGFGMAPFDGPATFDDDTTHEAKRSRT